MLNIDTIGATVLALLTLIELLISLLNKEGARLKDMLANICLGLLVILTGFFMKAIALLVYSVIYCVAFIKPEDSLLLWIIGFFLCDFVLYIYHFLSHRTRLLWAAHVAHHSSLHYNLSVGFRINFFHLFYRFIFWAPLCLIGITPEMILFLESLTAIWNFLIHTEKQKGHSLFRNLVTKTVSNINVKVNVTDVTSLLLESDTGLLNAAKPFYPFTTQPTKGSSFLINYPEIFSKKWKNIDVTINWKNTPNSFVTHYDAYKTNYLDANENASSSIVDKDSYFTATAAVLNKENSIKKDEKVVLFTANKATKGYQTDFSVKEDNYDIDKSGPIRLTLNQSFLHSLYPKIYTLAILSKDAKPTIPNEAYTPIIETISLNYTAEENTDFTHQTEE